MNSLQYQENVIAPGERDRHDIRRYEFKALEAQSEESLLTKSPEIALPLENITQQANVSEASTEGEDGHGVRVDSPPPQMMGGVEVELIERLLEKNDGLAKALEDIQARLERQQEEMEKILREAKEESRQQGIREGEEKAKMELQEEVNTQLQAFGDSIAQLGETSLKMEQQIENIEKDLSLIAIDIAKEIIAKEVSLESSEIALSLSRRLLESLKEATKILIKLNPEDYALLLDRFDGDERIKLQADKAIAKGGVVVISDSGNLDGTIMSRFENLKRSILEGGQG